MIVNSVLAIDPGTTHSGVVLYGAGMIVFSGVYENKEVIDLLKNKDIPNNVAIEMIASYGMAVGKEVFETCVWIGRFIQTLGGMERVRLIFRKDVTMHLCQSMKAKDTNIRQAVIDRYGGKAKAIGTVKQQGPLYGVKSHAWAALAVALTATET